MSQSLDWRDHLGLVYLAMKKQKNAMDYYRVDEEDMVVILTTKLWYCLRPGMFKPEKGFAVSTYLMTCLQREIIRESRKIAGHSSRGNTYRSRGVRQTYSISATEKGNAIGPMLGRMDKNYDRVDDLDALEMALHQAPLTEEERAYLKLFARGMKVNQSKWASGEVVTDRVKSLRARSLAVLREEGRAIAESFEE